MRVVNKAIEPIVVPLSVLLCNLVSTLLLQVIDPLVMTKMKKQDKVDVLERRSVS